MPIFYVQMVYKVAETFQVEADDEDGARQKVDDGAGESIGEDVIPGSTQRSSKWKVSRSLEGLDT